MEAVEVHSVKKMAGLYVQSSKYSYLIHCILHIVYYCIHFICASWLLQRATLNPEVTSKAHNLNRLYV